MSNFPQDNTSAAWHRYFAIECNNLAWDLTVVTRTAEQDQQLLDLAHAAAFHWHAVGTESNHMRATMLLAEAHCLAGSPELALRFGNTMQPYFANHPTEPWELEFAHGILAHAVKLNGDTAQHATLYQLAQEALNQIESSQERELVDATFQHIPRP
jgi:hypothetical protein